MNPEGRRPNAGHSRISLGLDNAHPLRVGTIVSMTTTVNDYLRGQVVGAHTVIRTGIVTRGTFSGENVLRDILGHIIHVYLLI